MNESLKLSIFETVGSPLCVASSDGQKVYDRLEAALEEERNVTLSFQNVTTLTAAFLNAAIGQLYRTFSEDEIRSLLHPQDMRQDDIVLLKRVVETAKEYFKDPQKDEMKPCPICNKIIDYDEDEATLICYACGFSWNADHEEHIKLYQAFPRRAGKWIKCSERLPDDDIDAFCKLNKDGLVEAWYDGDPVADLGWEPE